MRMFEDDDAGYLGWIERNQHGFVVNTFRKPDPGYLMLHRTSCGTIRGKPARGERWTTGDFIRVCAETRADLDGIYAHLYGLSRDDFAYILEQFPIVKRKDEAAFGEYRTARLCLEAYDRFVADFRSVTFGFAEPPEHVHAMSTL